MQIVESTDHPQADSRAAVVALPARRAGTIPVTVRLDPPRYDRLKRLVRRLSITGQSIIQTALDSYLQRGSHPQRTACRRDPRMDADGDGGEGGLKRPGFEPDVDRARQQA